MTDHAKTPVLNTTRRQFAAMGLVAATAAATGVSATAHAAPLPVAARAVGSLSTATLFAPEAGEHPGLVMFASSAASASANAAVAKDLATQGWSVLLVDTPEFRDPRQIARDAVTHAAWLEDQPGVIKAQGGYTLRNFSAAFPKFSLASRAARQQAGLAGSLFAVPSKLQAKHDSLNEAARALHRLAA